MRESKHTPRPDRPDRHLRLQACRARRQRATEARRGLSEAYHPINIENGLAQDAETVARRLDDCFDQLDQVAEEAGLSQKARDRLAKARRVRPLMQATLDFFWTTVQIWFAKWDLSPAVVKLTREILIPVDGGRAKTPARAG